MPVPAYWTAMSPSAVTAASLQARFHARLLLVLCALLGVVLMHGVSSEHTLMAPGAHMTPVSMAGHTSASAATGSQVARRVHAAAEAATATVRPRVGPDGHSPTMSHSACVAVLRESAAVPGPLTAVAFAGLPFPTRAAVDDGGSLNVRQRGPTAPDLVSELCISRT